MNKLLETFYKTVKNTIEKENAEKKRLAELRGISEKKLKKAYTNMIKNQPKDFDEIKTRLGRKWKTTLKTALPLVKKFRYMFSKYEKLSHIPISTESQNWQQGFTNQKQLYRILQSLQNIGLLQKANDKSSFYSASNINSNFHSVAFTYMRNPAVLEMLESYYKENGLIDTNKIDYNLTDTIDILPTDIKDLSEIKEYKVTQKTRINDTDENIILGLHKHYPQLSYFNKIVDDLNKQAINEKEIIKAKFNIKKSKANKKTVSSIGFRQTNGIVSYKARENGKDNYSGVWRQEYLDNFFGVDNWQEYDVKASILQVNRLIQKGLPMNYNDDDLYAKIYGKDWNSVCSREVFKSFFMRLYFSSTNQIIRDIFAKKSGNNKGKVLISDEARKIYTAEIERLKVNLNKYIGESLKSEIFLHESFIYLLVRQELAKRNIKVSQVYDGFYFEKGEIPTNIKEIVKKCSIFYYNKFIKKEEKNEMVKQPKPDDIFLQHIQTLDMQEDVTELNGEKLEYPLTDEELKGLKFNYLSENDILENRHKMKKTNF